MITKLEDMIKAQPAALAAVAALDLTAAAATLAGARRIWLVGTGTSAHAAELGATALQELGLDARWATAAEFARRTGSLPPGDAAIVITHTGETAYAQRCRHALLAAGTPLVTITGPAAGWPEAITTPVTEQSETYTVSYTTALAVLARLAGHLGAPDSDAAAVLATAQRVAEVLAERASDIGPARAMAIVGARDWAVTAREGALKIREGARILCEGFDAERLLHGAAVPYTAGDALIVLQPSADPDGLTAALAEAARAEGIQVTVLTEEQPAASPLLQQIPMTVRLQLLALRLAQERGQDPDVAIVGAWARPALWEYGSSGAGD
jgi:glucosamine--fructose-6-phosphate aminotransferase (isomerizing)